MRAFLQTKNRRASLSLSCTKPRLLRGTACGGVSTDTRQGDFIQLARTLEISEGPAPWWLLRKPLQLALSFLTEHPAAF